MDISQETLKNIIHAPGVYLFKNSEGIVIYVGKAIDLYKRVHQYFSKGNISEKTQRLIQSAKTLETIPVRTEFDALLLEAKLIRHYSPKYNAIAKDDKSPAYICINTKHPLAVVSLTRKPKAEIEKHMSYFGPFQTTKTASKLLKTIRRSIPFCMQKQRNGKPCFYTHLKLCSPCPSLIEKIENKELKQELTNQYRKNIHRLIGVLSGTSSVVIKQMEQEMYKEAKLEHFEQAEILKQQINHLLAITNNHYEPFFFEEIDALKKAPEEELQALQEIITPYFPSLSQLSRIECFDISNTSGTDATGSMVVLTDGIADKREYRKFRIRKSGTPNDVAMMIETLTRRLNHDDWGVPDLLIVDGGKPQVGAIHKLLFDIGKNIPLIGLAKRREEIICIEHGIFKTIRLPMTSPAIHIVQRIRDEAHRFALSYHRKLRTKRHAFTNLQANRTI